MSGPWVRPPQRLPRSAPEVQATIAATVSPSPRNSGPPESPTQAPAPARSRLPPTTGWSIAARAPRAWRCATRRRSSARPRGRRRSRRGSFPRRPPDRRRRRGARRRSAGRAASPFRSARGRSRRPAERRRPHGTEDGRRPLAPASVQVGRPRRGRRPPCRAATARNALRSGRFVGPGRRRCKGLRVAGARVSTMTRWSAKRAPDSLGPTTAPAGVPDSGGGEGDQRAQPRPSGQFVANHAGMSVRRDWRAAARATIVAHSSLIQGRRERLRHAACVDDRPRPGALRRRRRLGPSRRGRGSPRVKSGCLPPSETREEIKTHRLLEPFAALKSAATQFKAEALSAKLCRNGDELVYEIALLHRDGRLVHVVTNAATGKLISVRNAREPTPKN